MEPTDSLATREWMCTLHKVNGEEMFGTPSAGAYRLVLRSRSEMWFIMCDLVQRPRRKVEEPARSGGSE
jgi:hypothetical protein